MYILYQDLMNERMNEKDLSLEQFTSFSVVEISTLEVKGTNMARGGVNSLFKNSTNSLEQEVSK